MATQVLIQQPDETIKQVQVRSNWTMGILLACYGLLAFVSVFLSGQMLAGQLPPDYQMPAPMWVMALANAGIILVSYGLIALGGLFFSRKISLPEIWEPTVTNYQRFIIPLMVGVVGGMVLIAADQFFLQYNTLGALPHPQFPLSIIASYTAGVGEELLFRFFFISLWTWLVSNVLLRGRAKNGVYWFFAVISSLVFAASHFPAVLYLYKFTSINQLPTMMIVEIFLLNSVIGLISAWLLKHYGYLAAAGGHFWTDIVWHVIWGAMSA
jgi:hypothetical protein